MLEVMSLAAMVMTKMVVDIALACETCFDEAVIVLMMLVVNVMIAIMTLRAFWSLPLSHNTRCRLIPHYALLRQAV